jgi:aspartyl-tRNA(Asn)/glutamyl-tRNA(Gln) amidotransferase subunit A
VSAPVWARPIEALAPDIMAGRVTSVALTEACLERIKTFDGRIESFVHLAEGALEQARHCDREIATGRWLGPLHGIPVGIKDLYLTADMPTGAGTKAPGVSFPRVDAAAVARLRKAGAVFLGKTTTHEYAWGTVTPPTRNPWKTDRVPGGSSGGSAAAVAAGFCIAATGSDTGGSIRIPASLCGVVGLKPTFGRVSRAGIVPHTWSLDHGGPLARTVADSAILLQVLAGFDPADPASQDRPVPDYGEALGKEIRGLRVGVCRNHFFGRNQADVEAALETAIRDLAGQGAAIREFRIPRLDLSLGAIFAIELSSSTAYHDAALRAGRTRHYQPDVRALVEIGRFVTGPDYLKAEQFRRLLMEDYRRAFAEVDVVVGPTTPLTAWPVGQWTVEIAGRPESVLAASWRLTYPYNLTGLPAISVPCGQDRDGLPIGLQIAARPFEEMTVLRVAHAYERSHGWAATRPDM